MSEAFLAISIPITKCHSSVRVYAEEAGEKRRLVLLGDERWLPEVLKNLIRLIPRFLARPNVFKNDNDYPTGVIVPNQEMMQLNK